ncbi:MAG: heat-inducible transcriptional repressor HrcA [Pseudomonadota bacterium]
MNNDIDELKSLDMRSKEVFRHIVETYLAKGDPVGSRNLSKQLPIALSPASIRNVMSDLEELGLIYSPHVSAGRLPTESGLRIFVDGLLEIGELESNERKQIETQMEGSAKEKSVDEVLTEVGDLIAGLSNCAGVVLTDKNNNYLKHIEFVPLNPNKALAVLVAEDGSIENRIVQLPEGLPPSALVEASNYLNHHIRNMTLSEARDHVERESQHIKKELDTLTSQLISDGFATWSGGHEDGKSLIIRGRSHLLDDLDKMEDLDRIRTLFDDLEAKKELIQLLGLSEQAEGVRIFIGSENKLFSLSGSSIIISPFENSNKKIVGALGIIGPTRLNYARIIPMVDYTAKLVGRLLT